jgi:hypothetical protein
LLFFPVFAKLQPRRSLDSSSSLTSIPCLRSPNSHGIISFADPHPITPTESYRYKNIGGRGHLPLSDPYHLFRTTYPLSFHILAHSFALFCTHEELNSFVFKRFRTLRQKTDRRGVAGPALTPLSNRTCVAANGKVEIDLAHHTGEFWSAAVRRRFSSRGGTARCGDRSSLAR